MLWVLIFFLLCVLQISSLSSLSSHSFYGVFDKILAPLNFFYDHVVSRYSFPHCFHILCFVFKMLLHLKVF